MSERIAVVRRAFELVRAGDVESVIAIASPEVEFSTFLTEVEGSSYQGHDGVRAWQADLRASFAHYEPAPPSARSYPGVHPRSTETSAAAR